MVAQKPFSNSSSAKRYVAFIVTTFAAGIIVHLFCEHMLFLERLRAIDQLSTAGSHINNMKTTSLAALIDTLEGNSPLLLLWSFLSELGFFLSASVVVHAFYFLLIKKEENATLDKVQELFFKATRASIDGIYGGVHKWGFVKFHDSIESKDLFKELQPGDELCWLETYDPSIERSIAELQAALARGVTIRILALDPGSEVAPWRARELTFYPLKHRESEFFRGGILHFLEGIQGAIAGAVAAPHNVGEIVRKYSDLPGVPLYIVKKANGDLRAFTGFYLNRPSRSLVHIEWGGRTDDMQGNAFVHTLLSYFNEKWERAARPDLPDCSGQWDYVMEGEDIEWSAAGTCTIEQRGRTTSFTGQRRSINGASVTPISWRSNWSELSVDDASTGQVFIRMDYSIDSQQNRDEYAAFGRLALSRQLDGRALKMQGQYFVLQQAPGDEVATASRFGTLRLVRTDEHSGAQTSASEAQTAAGEAPAETFATG